MHFFRAAIKDSKIKACVPKEDDCVNGKTYKDTCDGLPEADQSVTFSGASSMKVSISVALIAILMPLLLVGY